AEQVPDEAGGDAGAGRWQRIVTGEEEPDADAPADRDEPQTSMALEDEAVGRDGRPELPESADGAREELPTAETESEDVPEVEASSDGGDPSEPGPSEPDVDEAPAGGYSVADRVDRDREAAARQRPSWADPVDAGIEGLREEARRMARDDAEVDVPALEGDGSPSQSELQLRDRCLAFFERWKSRQRKRFRNAIAEAEETIAEKLGQASLAVDKMERLTSELVRLKARVRIRRSEISDELKQQAEGGSTGLSTRIYVAAISFLGVVEFFANAPVFTALLPRDPLTERQIQLVSETSQGWLAGLERVFAQLILRPDAALLAAGVVTFLCVLAHFFGHSLRDLVIKHDREVRKEAVSSRSPLENVVPMVLTGLGLALVLGVLYEARVTLGEVGERQYNQDMAVVEELRREAEFLRTDGDLLEANQQVNQADDMQAAASNLLEYSRSMSRMSFPILLLNLTLVLCAMSAAYFHRRDSRGEYFTEQPFESERRDLIEEAESVAEHVSGLLSDAVRGIRELRSSVGTRPLEDWRSVVAQLESVVALYRSENGRARGVDPGTIPAFSEPVSLDAVVEDDSVVEYGGDPGDYRRDYDRLADRFSKVRQKFNEQVVEGEIEA
ncbi:MAG: hypothetical protein ACOC83_10035, partial [Gemmatimonadota bacterium]